MVELLKSQGRERGTWWPATVDGKRTATVCCPDCGERAYLDHEIGETGIVTPSLICPNGKCEFHDHVQLAGWAP